MPGRVRRSRPFVQNDLPGESVLLEDRPQAGLPYESNRAVLGSYGLGFRWPLGPLAVIRLDLGWRFSSDQYQGYALSTEDKRPFFLSLFFGYNY